MPICINLLAESQAANELRRNDPVKRAMLAGVSAVALVIFWSSFLQIQIYLNRSRQDTIDAQWKSIEAPFNQGVISRRKTSEIEQRLAALQNLTTNRFLWGTVLNEFQKTFADLEAVRTVRFKGEQTYTILEEIRAKSEGGRPPSGARPASAIERVLLKIDARDYSLLHGSNVDKFRLAIANAGYFQSALSKTNGVSLLSRSALQVDPADERSSFVSFSLQCNYPETIRR